MNNDVNIRPLVVSDAYISYKYRSDKDVFKFALNDNPYGTTLDDEIKWYQECTQRSYEKRFAITYKGEYIGNVFFDMFNNFSCEAHIHLFKYRGKGIGKIALNKAITIMEQSGFDGFYAFINENNLPSIKLFTNAGFRFSMKSQDIKLYIKGNLSYV